MTKTFADEVKIMLGTIEDAKRRVLARKHNLEHPEIVERDIWISNPVSPKEFITSPHFLGDKIGIGGFWPVILEDIETIFSGPDKFGRPSYFPAVNVFLDDEGVGCLDEDTEIYTLDGRSKIKDLIEFSRFYVNAMHGNRVSHFACIGGVDNGRKECFEVRLASGKKISATSNHLFYTGSGWVPVSDLSAGSFVATPRSLELDERTCFSDDQISILAYLIGDGCICGGGIIFTNARDALLDDFTRCCEGLGCKINVANKKGRTKNLYASYGNKKHHPIRQMLKRVGLWGKNSYGKRVPQEVIYSTKRQIGLFLNRLYSTDGCVEEKSVCYYTVSEKLAEDVATCLLRLGIHGRIRGRVTRCNGKLFNSFSVSVYGSDLLRFFLNVGFIIGKEKESERLLSKVRCSKRNSNVDVVPFNNESLKRRIDGVGNYRYWWQTYKNLPEANMSRDRLRKFAEDIGDSSLLDFSNSDIFWDRVFSIKSVGVRRVYDLSVPVANNFVANNIIVHNSGKSSKTALMNAYFAHIILSLKDPCGYFGLQQSTMLFFNVAPTEDKARDIVFAKTSALINRCRWFLETNNLPESRLKSRLKFYRNINTSGMSQSELEQLESLEEKGKAESMPVLMIAPGTSKVSAPVGADLLMGVIDEAASPGGYETADHDRAADVFLNMNERRLSRFQDDGLIVAISSAGTEDRWLEKEITRLEVFRKQNGIPPEQKIVEMNGLRYMYCRRPSYVANPKYKKYFDIGDVFTYQNQRITDDGVVLIDDLVIPKFFEQKFLLEPEDSLRNVCAISSASSYRWIRDWDGIVARINTGRQDPLPDNGKDEPLTPKMAVDMLPQSWMGDTNNFYYAHVDFASGGTASSGKDGAGLCISHRGPDVVRGEGANEVKLPTAVIDLSVRFKSHGKTIRAEGKLKDSQSELQFADIRDFLIWCHKTRNFKFAKITFDGWQSRDSIQLLTNMGYLCDIDAVTNESYDTLRTMWYDGRIDVFRDEHMLWEMRRLERKQNGKIEKSVGASDDEIECVAKSVELCVIGEMPEIKKQRAIGFAAHGVINARGLPQVHQRGQMSRAAPMIPGMLQPRGLPMPNKPRKQ